MAIIGEISVQATSDPDVKAYHTRFEMTSSQETGVRGGASELSEFGRLVLQVRGVARIDLGPYIMLITKAKLFQWIEVEEGVESILKIFAISQKQLQDAIDEAGPQLGIKKLGPAGSSPSEKVN